ncbi:RagB/SusD family nutrient uptake outer membrane protein [Thermophagus sp. OGC60D27]|uniref:RagB/SusD family nutrient uptake outer membrane protein n=1 Tax=Thermophagus sp. OGC60D27 TaxID=3458415 RepID=UPI004037A38C
MKIKSLYMLIVAFIIGVTGCDMEVVPSDALTGTQITSTSDGLPSLVNGGYALFKDFPDPDETNNWYLRQYFQLIDFAGDDIVCGYKSEDDLTNSFRYNDRSSEKSNINSFWEVSYKIIYGANVSIEMADRKGNDVLTNHLKGEAYFLRAFATHAVTRLFAKHYSQANASEPGVILREDALDTQPKARATLEETYDYIIGSLKSAASLMSEEIPAERQSKGYASKYSAWALLSRVYLDKGDYQNVIAYADSVVNSEMYSLESADSYADYFVNAKNSDETIWCIPFLTIDDKLTASVASMIYNGDNCWGEEGASLSLLKDMGFGSDLQNVDQRWQYIDAQNPGLKNGVLLYFISKFSNQDNSSTLSSPVMLRLAEVYLNRAEAYAQLGQIENAIDDVNMIRENRMIPGEYGTMSDFLYDVGRDNITTTNVLNVVLKERRIELAFEGHRLFDIKRNELPLERNYWGYHLDNYNGIPTSSEPGLDAPGAFIPANDPRFVYPIPSRELSTNNLVVPN